VAPGFRFAARALGEAFRAHGREGTGLELAISPSFGEGGGVKLGMGGSARACVLAAEAARWALDDGFDALKLSLVAHAVEQGMKGSGGDVACVFAGGVARYKRYPVEALAQASASGQYGAALLSSPPVELARVPAPQLRLVYAFAGESASTTRLIGAAERRLDEGARAAFVAASDEAGALLEDGLVRGDFAALREAVPRLHGLLCGVGPLETEPMRRILALTRSVGGVGKISGAGGGDGLVLFAPDDGARAELLAALGARGFLALPLELEPGLRTEPVLPAALSGWL
jgi:phosphomevalonate kinase